MNNKIKILLIVGDQRRHLYFASFINRYFPLAGLVLVERGIDIPTPPDNLPEIDYTNFQKHFKDRTEAEIKHFQDIDQIKAPVLKVAFDKLNTEEVVDFLNKIKPNYVFVFGPGLIKSPVIESLPKETINLHLGLSPRYRGSATLFWPFYFLEPNYAGCTFHYLADQPDAGNIIHQVVPKLEYGDKIHDVSCKVIKASSSAVIDLIKLHLEKKGWASYPQKHSGKNFLDSDFHPLHLRLIYNTFNSKIVDYYLDGILRTRDPKLIDQFKILQ
jgi:folate-dependent phosphoribosylglycinamide formyltransferase PurN